MAQERRYKLVEQWLDSKTELRAGVFSRAIRRQVCLRVTVVVTLLAITVAGLLLVIFGAWSLSSNSHLRENYAMVGTVVGGSLLLLTCFVLLAVLCLGWEPCWPGGQRRRSSATVDALQGQCQDIVLVNGQPLESENLAVINEGPCRLFGTEARPSTSVSAPALVLHDSINSPAPNVKTSPRELDIREMRFLTPSIYRGGNKYAPLAQQEEISPSLRSSFQSMDHL